MLTRRTRLSGPVLTVPQVFELANAMRYRRLRALILVTAFATLRWGEVTALRRQDVAPDGSWVRVSVAHTEVVGRGIVVGPPKSRAGARTVSIPIAIRPELVEHLRDYTPATSGRRRPARVPKDLMSRMGHDDMRAALIYQRATSAADRRIADGLSGLVDDHRRGAARPHDDEHDPPAAG